MSRCSRWFLYMRKAYNSLNRGWCMESMRGCRTDQKTVRLISHYCDNLRFAPKASRFLEMDYGTGIEVTQGNYAFPMIIKIELD